jgi:uncharacterized protein YjbI with pentapeptide repeats
MSIRIRFPPTVTRSLKVNAVVQAVYFWWWKMLYAWWRKIKKIRQHPGIIKAIIAAVCVGIIFTFLVHVFGWNWTGLNGGYGQVTIHTAAKDTVLPPAKTLWDWLQLLIVPLVIAVGGYLFNLTVNKNERIIAQDAQQEATLQEYINKMSELLLDRKLRESNPGDEVRKIARVRTLTVLPRLNGSRKSNVIQFLYEAGLIHKSGRIVDLTHADLTNVTLDGLTLLEADLSQTNLRGASILDADLIGANLRRTRLQDVKLSLTRLMGAVLDYAWLEKTDLRGADLRGASLRHVFFVDTDLSGADLRGVTGVSQRGIVSSRGIKALKDATLPDGSRNTLMPRDC